MKSTIQPAHSSLAASTAVAAFLSIVAFPCVARAQVTLFFGSDVHTDTAALSTKLASLCSPTQCNFVGLVGDYAASAGFCDAGADDAINTTIASYYTDARFLTQGNHEMTSAGGACSGAATDYYTDDSGLRVQGSNYEVFVIGAKDLLTAASYSTLFNSLSAQCWTSDTARMQKVFVVMSHVPLHSSKSLTGLVKDPGKSKATTQKDRLMQIYTLLSQCSQQRNIVFLWGHTHGKDSATKIEYDLNVNYVVSYTGSTPIGGSGNPHVYSEFNNAIPSFAYLNAGYIQPRNGITSATRITIQPWTYEIWREGEQQPGAPVSEPRYAKWDPGVP